MYKRIDDTTFSFVIPPRVISTSDPEEMRRLSGDPDFVSEELYPGQADGHKYGPGDKLRLVGLEDSPEYNGTEVVITQIRKDGPRGKAYYVRGEINKLANWVYEFRLERP